MFADAVAVGRRVHGLRAARGFTLQEFAALAGVPVGAMSALERGEPTATVTTLCAAVQALQVPFAAVFEEPAAPAARPAEPRTFADLRVGPLAGRTFATLPEFAVAAVVEGGHPVSVVAKIFRVPSWKLESWIRDGVPTPPGGRRAR